jgi:hypothetical protein
MEKRTKLVIAGAAVVGALGLGIAGVTVAGASGDEDTPPITGPDLDRASTVALEHTGEGRVTETELGDEEGAYEVEVTLEDGSQVDVHLDEDFNVLSTENDGVEDEGQGDDD